MPFTTSCGAIAAACWPKGLADRRWSSISSGSWNRPSWNCREAAREVELDLLAPVDREKSRLLHALAVLQIAGYQHKGGTDFLARQDLTRLWELWRLSWSPEFEATAIEAARYGVSLDEAVAARLTELAAIDERSAARAAALLVQAAQVGVEVISAPLLARLESLVLEEAEFTAAARALGHLLFLYCHDEAFGAARLPRIGDLLAQTFARALWLFDSLGQSTQPPKELLQAMHVLLEAYERAGDVLADSADEFAVVLARVEADAFKPAQLRGAALGMLWTLGQAAPESVLDRMRLFTHAEQLGDFLTGLFALAREVAQRNPQLVQSIDLALLEFTSEEFQQTLPSMRLAFTYFTPREKHYMLSTLFESLGLKPTQPLAALKVDAQTAAAALALEERLFAAFAAIRTGRRARHERRTAAGPLAAGDGPRRGATLWRASGEDQLRDQCLDFLYRREYGGGRNVRQAGEGQQGGIWANPC